MEFKRPCFYCDGDLDPLAQTTVQRVVGWEQRVRVRTSGKPGGSDILAREPRDEFAHLACVKDRRNGIAAGQATLI